jgi:malate dehydrogenase (oxaloacetate-decarboxylating)(NADP+)
MVDEGICVPILLGREDKIRGIIAEQHLDLGEVEILDPEAVTWRDEVVDAFYQLRKRKGITPYEADRQTRRRIVFGALMCRMGRADGLVAGISSYYPETITPCLQVVGTRKGVKKVCGVYVLVLKNRVVFFADTTMAIDPTAEELAEIAILTADLVQHRFAMEPRIAMLSFSNFGSVDHPSPRKMQKAALLVKQHRPDLHCDGELQADTALNADILGESYPFADVQGGANVLIFPDLNSGNIAYKLIQRLAGAEVIGPITCGMDRPANVLQRHSDMDDIINLTALTVVEAQQR